jgi:Exostosin family
MATSLHLNLPLNFIQSVRLSHAIMETDYEVCLAPEDEAKFSLLRQKFGANYKVTDRRPSALSGLQISHSELRTSVGSIERSLIFPNAIFDYCRALWPKKRDVRFVFAGLVTNCRKNFFEQLLAQNYPGTQFDLDSWAKPNLWSRLQLKLSRKLGIRHIPKAIKRKCNQIVFWSSQRGRSFPIKSWDDEYFKLMANAEFVLCPNGDYVWTYRFFEAAMCGAIPVIESYCPAYDGFRFKTVAQPLETMTWSKEDADHNYNLCRSRLTVPKDTLQAEIAKLLQASSIPRDQQIPNT